MQATPARTACATGAMPGSMDRPRFTASREAAASRAYVTWLWESPGCGMCFRARRRLSRRERMAGECARVLSGPLAPSLIRSYRAEARITAKIAENAIHRRWPQFPGRPMDGSDKLVVDDWCSAPMPASGRLRQRRALQDPRGLTWTMTRSITPSSIDKRR